MPCKLYSPLGLWSVILCWEILAGLYPLLWIQVLADGILGWHWFIVFRSLQQKLPCSLILFVTKIAPIPSQVSLSFLLPFYPRLNCIMSWSTCYDDFSDVNQDFSSRRSFNQVSSFSLPNQNNFDESSNGGYISIAHLSPGISSQVRVLHDAYMSVAHQSTCSSQGYGLSYVCILCVI